MTLETPLLGRYLVLVRTDSMNSIDLQLRVDEVNVYVCQEYPLPGWSTKYPIKSTLFNAHRDEILEKELEYK